MRYAQTTYIDFGASLGRKALISWPDLSSLALRRHEIKRLILPSKSCADLIGVKGISICATDRREDKALTTMPSRLRDKSGHRRKAFLLSVPQAFVDFRTGEGQLLQSRSDLLCNCFLPPDDLVSENEGGLSGAVVL